MSDDIHYDVYDQVADEVAEGDLTGFFVGWPAIPSASTLLSAFAGSYCSILARSHDGRVVGFVAAISDGALSAHIPLLEVVPEYQGRGIGSHLMQLILERLRELYMVDVCCDPELVPFYRDAGLSELSAMGVRRPESIPTD